MDYDRFEIQKQFLGIFRGLKFNFCRLQFYSGRRVPLRNAVLRSYEQATAKARAYITPNFIAVHGRSRHAKLSIHSDSKVKIAPVHSDFLWVAQFIARHKSFVADFNVPNAGTPVGVSLALDFQS